MCLYGSESATNMLRYRMTPWTKFHVLTRHPLLVVIAWHRARPRAILVKLMNSQPAADLIAPWKISGKPEVIELQKMFKQSFLMVILD